MSHVDSGFCVTDIATLAKTVKEQCPELELVRQNTYRTWIADNGRLVGDYPLPGIYQIKLMGALKKQGVDVHAKAAEKGVTLPKNLLDLEKKPWTLEEQRKMFQNNTFQQAYDKLCKQVVGKDSEFVIKYKKDKGSKRAYEIGLVPHPVNKGEYVMMADFYNQGNGLLNTKGLGRHQNKRGADGKPTDTWGGELKKAYAVNAAEKQIQAQIAAGNPEYGSYKKEILPGGQVKLSVQPRGGM